MRAPRAALQPRPPAGRVERLRHGGGRCQAAVGATLRVHASGPRRLSRGGAGPAPLVLSEGGPAHGQ